MGTLRRALALEDEQRPDGALLAAFVLVVVGLLSIAALGFGVALIVGTASGAISEPDERANGFRCGS